MSSPETSIWVGCVYEEATNDGLVGGEIVQLWLTITMEGLLLCLRQQKAREAFPSRPPREMEREGGREKREREREGESWVAKDQGESNFSSTHPMANI